MSGVLIDWEVEVLHFDGRVPVRVSAWLETSADGDDWARVHGASCSAPFDGQTPVRLRCKGSVEPGDHIRMVVDSSEAGGVLVVWKRWR